MARAAALVLLCTATLALAACDSGDSTESSTTTTTTPPPPKETRDPLPNRPRDWRRYVNERGGFAVLLPRGWKPKTRGSSSLIRSFDRLVAISIAPDRSAAGLAAPLRGYATRTAGSLRGYLRPPEVKGTRPFRHRYDGIEAYGTARARGGVDQRVSVIVLRRGRLATFTVVLAANAKHAANRSERIARRVIATLRSRPPRGGRG